MRPAQSISGQGASEFSEAPLLGDANHNEGDSYGSVDDGSRSEAQRRKITPLPKGQIALLAYMRIATPLVDTQSLPVCLFFFFSLLDTFSSSSPTLSLTFDIEHRSNHVQLPSTHVLSQPRSLYQATLVHLATSESLEQYII